MGASPRCRPLIAGSETVFCKDKAGYDANCESSSLRSKGARVGYYLSTNQTMTEIEDEQFYRDTESIAFPKLDDRQLAMLECWRPWARAALSGAGN
jgi:hypothetical protein